MDGQNPRTGLFFRAHLGALYERLTEFSSGKRDIFSRTQCNIGRAVWTQLRMVCST